jgi:hypothetical protein
MARAHETASVKQIQLSLSTHKPIEEEKIIRKSSYKAVIIVNRHHHRQLKENHHAVCVNSVNRVPSD